MNFIDAVRSGHLIKRKEKDYIPGGHGIDPITFLFHWPETIISFCTMEDIRSNDWEVMPPNTKDVA